MSKEVIIPEEMAEEQLESLFDYYEIDLEEDLADEEEDSAAAALQAKKLRKKLLKGIMYGRLEVVPNEKGGVDVVQILIDPPNKQLEQLVWNNMTGAAKLTIKDSKKNSPMKMLYDFAGAVTKSSGSTIAALKGLDLSTAEALANIFLAV